MPSTLEVLAGTSYDQNTHVDIQVNDETNLTVLDSDLMSAKVAVRIQDYQGMFEFQNSFMIFC